MARTPKPGSPVRGSRTGKPVMALLDLLGRRWALRVLWELRSGALTSRALRKACGGLSPTVLSARTKELREAGIVALEEPDGYTLTPLGRELFECFVPVVEWSERWAHKTGRRRTSLLK
jgi:DNA-binding HxlR family transcriptional regulator